MKEAKRHAKVGEYIKIVDCNDIMGKGYENGDIFIVIRDSGYHTVNGISEKYICDDGWCFYDEEYVVLEDYNPDETKQTKIVVDKINTEEIVVPKTNLEIINDVVKTLQNSLSFDFKIDTNKLHNIDGADALCLYCDELINEEREEEDMNKLVDLYYERKRKELTEKYDEKIDNDFNDIEVVKQYKTLIENFEKEQESLFKTIENFDNDYLLASCDANCYKYTLNESCIKTELTNKYKDDYRKELNSLNELKDEVDAQLSLSDDLNYQLEVLTRYDIIDKKTKKLKA